MVEFMQTSTPFEIKLAGSYVFHLTGYTNNKSLTGLNG